MKIALAIIGALIGPFAGFFGTWYVYTYGRAVGMDAGLEAFFFSLFAGAPLGLITFCLIGLWLGRLLEPVAKDNVADSDEEELEMHADRGGTVKVRVDP